MRDSLELAGEVRTTLAAHIEAQQYYTVDLDPSDGSAIDCLARELVNLSVFLFKRFRIQ